MASRYTAVYSLLRCIQDSTRATKTNPYQIAKATGIPLHSVQKLLRQEINPTLRNVEKILAGFGLKLYSRQAGPVRIKAGPRTSKSNKA